MPKKLCQPYQSLRDSCFFFFFLIENNIFSIKVRTFSFYIAVSRGCCENDLNNIVIHGG